MADPRDDFPNVEALSPQPELPNPFKTLDGELVKTKEDWYGTRRPELQSIFQHYMYGYLPPAPNVKSNVVTQESICEGAGIVKNIRLTFDVPGIPGIQLAAFVPESDDPVPVVLGTNKYGNQTVLDDIAVTASGELAGLPSEAREYYGKRGMRTDVWAIENALERGYAIVTFHVGDIEPDDPAAEGICACYPDPPGPSKSQWGTLAAWAWGLHRGVDYLYEDTDMDDNAISVTGHSRRGKAALLAGALDDRIALVAPHQSGTGGMALSRNNSQETVERITQDFPHWFADRFAIFSNQEEYLPIDQHLLVALVAPRPLLDTEGVCDDWANPPQALRNLQAADQIYEFLGTDGLADELVGVDESLSKANVGTIAQYRRNTEHILDVEYWNAIFDFADIHLR